MTKIRIALCQMNVVDNKDELIDLLKIEAPDLFTVTTPALSKYINNISRHKLHIKWNIKIK